MIHEVTGDILLTKAQAIAHGVAPNDPFDRGLALAIREKFPQMHKDFHHYTHQTHPKAGEIWGWGGFGKRIINLLTQEGSFDHGGKPGHATAANVNHCLKRLRHFIEHEKIASIALPMIATGVGGLKAAEIMPLIKSHLGDLKIPVFVYSTYKPNVEAAEPGV